jgi:hypothetical protein
MSEHPEERERMGLAAQSQIYEKWNNDRQIEQLIGFYERTLALGSLPKKAVSTSA